MARKADMRGGAQRALKDLRQADLEHLNHTSLFDYLWVGSWL